MADQTLAGLTNQAIRVRGRTFTQEFPETATQTFKAGDLVKIDSAGRINIAATAGNTLVSTGENLVGQAQEAASGTTDNMIAVTVFTEDTIITLPVYHATPASAVTAATNLDVLYALINETTGGWMVDIGTTTNGILLGLRNAKSYDGASMAVGDDYGPMDCKVVTAGRFYQS